MRSRKFRQSDFGSLRTDDIIIRSEKQNGHLGNPVRANGDAPG
jgi:hypothetical protein